MGPDVGIKSSRFSKSCPKNSFYIKSNDFKVALGKSFQVFKLLSKNCNHIGAFYAVC